MWPFARGQIQTSVQAGGITMPRIRRSTARLRTGFPWGPTYRKPALPRTRRIPGESSLTWRRPAERAARTGSAGVGGKLERLRRATVGTHDLRDAVRVIAEQTSGRSSLRDAGIRRLTQRRGWRTTQAPSDTPLARLPCEVPPMHRRDWLKW